MIDYTLEEVLEEAIKYTTHSTFFIKSKNHFKAAVKNGWVDIAKEKISDNNKIILYNKLKEDALNYESFDDYKKYSKTNYIKSLSNGWLSDFTGHMLKKSKYSTITIEEAKMVASNYTNYVEFKKNCRKIYIFLHKTGKIQEICSHMEFPVRKYKSPWSQKKEKTELYLNNNNKISEIGLNTKPSNIGVSYKKSTIDIKKSKPVTKYSYKAIKKIAKKYTTKKDFRKYDYDAYMVAFEKDWLGSIGSHFISKKIVIDLKTVQEEALKYTTKGEFRKNSPIIYIYAQKNKLLEKVCAHMEQYKKILDIKSLQQYVDHSNNISAKYGYSGKKKIPTKICGHMKK